MSGELDFLIDCIESHNIRRGLDDKISSVRSSLSNLICDLTKKSNQFTNEIEEESKKIVKDIEKMSLLNPDFILKKQKEVYLRTLSDIISEFESINKDTSFLEEITNEIKGSDNVYHLDKIMARISVELVEAMNHIPETLFEIFGVTREKDLHNPDIYPLVSAFIHLEDMGFNPVFDKETNKIIVVKDNGNQIVAQTKDDKGNINVKFLSFQGKSCTKDIIDLETRLRKSGDLKKENKIYTKWYDSKEEKVEESKNVQLKNKRIYDELNTNKAKYYG